MLRIVDMPEFKDKQGRVFTLDENTNLGDAIKAMAEHNYGSVVVTGKGKKLAGIFTERDVLRRVAAQNVDLKKAKLKDVMTKDPSTASMEDTINDSMRRMSQGRFRHLPVVDDKGQVVGLLSQGDFVALTLSDAAKRFTQSAKASFAVGYQALFVLFGILAYTIILLSFLSA